ncbi:PhnA domain-containing protein [Flavilitoribacter nigricans]|uniref:PhnA protein n=1 Tax=Flavilitoribacter nigricans (strain ATCC 23147 / DSM 23189 / NBRC 102662 / NCIMB 1420 / SS-2) TaxID=1122177 RepID=A0A2D0N3R3_FLAN2|nr:alkylphosphonate utilization protein [Flavilitoribacter nigricans]PHN03145.1 PhnA protein [Flavilitoribacter nigricans DSM 23189 = NBRC 102662]
MSLPSELIDRSESKCELCSATEPLEAYTVPPRSGENPDDQVAVCPVCLDQLENPDQLQPEHWRCLNESMWSQVPAVQVVVYRLLKQLSGTDWAADLLNMMYLDEATLEWAQAGSNSVIHLDSNGNQLEAGDTVTLIQDLNVKGANFTAKRGTAVRRIRLVPDNAEQIEGKVEGQQIVILTKYVKKSN